jgi:hypothetical protein
MWHVAVAFVAALGGIAVLVAVFATPHGTQIGAEINLLSLPAPPRVFEVTARKANIDITLVDSLAETDGFAPSSTGPSRPSAESRAAGGAGPPATDINSPPAVVFITGELHGFGLPTSRLAAHSTFVAGPVPTLRYDIEQRGWFTDLDGVLSVRLPPANLTHVVVRVERGDIKVTDLTRAGVVSHGALHLDLKTAAGRIQRPTAMK